MHERCASTSCRGGARPLPCIRKIAVVKFRHIGDTLLATPVCRALKNSYPQAQVYAVVNSGTEEVLKNNPDLAGVITFDNAFREAPFYKTILRQTAFLRLVRRHRFDLVLDLSGGDRSAITAWASGAHTRVGYRRRGGMAFRDRMFTHLVERPPHRTGRHIVEQDMDVARRIGIDCSDTRLVLALSHEEEEWAGRFLMSHNVTPDERIVVAHPVTRWFFKCWDDRFFARLLDCVSGEFGARVVITGGSADRETLKAASIRKLMDSNALDISGKTTLRQLAAIIGKAALFIGVDSAPAHIAAAVRTPAVVLFGPTGYRNWGPREQEGVAVVKKWPCVPCGRAGCADRKESLCLKHTLPEDVLEAVRELIIRFPV